jgi:hypothetical protein
VVKQNWWLEDNDFVIQSPSSSLEMPWRGLVMSLQGWKKEVQARWDELNLESYCNQMGISYEQSFLNPLLQCATETNPFEGSEFTWMKNSVISAGVLHLHPVTTPVNEVTWEEWFIHTDGLHHHVLRNYEFEGSTDSWKGDDLDHPSQVCNVQWHLYNDTNMAPLPLR